MANLTLNNRLDKLENELKMMLLLKCPKKCAGSKQEHIVFRQSMNDNENSGVTEQIHLDVDTTVKSGRSRSAPSKFRNLPPTSIGKFTSSTHKTTPRPAKSYKRSSSASNNNKSRVSTVSRESAPEEYHNKQKRRADKENRERCICRKKASSTAEDSASSCVGIYDYKHIESVSERELNQEKSKRLILETELTNLRIEVEVLNKSKNEAQTLKEKYVELKACKEGFQKQLESLQQENSHLSRCLKEEVLLRSSSIEEVKFQATHTKKSIENTLEQITAESKEKSNQLLKELQEKNERISQLSKATEDLSKTICEKEKENCVIQCKCKEIETSVKMAKEKILVLQGTNVKLAKTVMHKHSSLQAIKNKAGKFKKEMTEYRTEIKKSLQEIERLKDVAQKQEKECYSVKNTVDTNALQGMKMLATKISSIESIQSDTMTKIVEENKTLQTNYDDLLKKLKTVEEDEDSKCKLLEEELKSLKQKDTDKENDKQELKELVQELTALIKKQKDRLKELNELNSKQVDMLRTQEAMISSHDEQLALAHMENSLVKQKCTENEKEVHFLKVSHDVELKDLKKQLEKCKQNLNEEKDKLLIKEKIIEDQVNTIADLKRKLQEKQMDLGDQELFQQELTRHNQVGNEILKKLEKENDMLKGELQEMQRCKEKLQHQLNSIDSLLKAECHAQAELSHQHTLVDSLRKKIALQERETQLQMAILVREKDHALAAAKFATEKLMESMQEFHKHSESQSQVRDVLAHMLQDKDRRIKNALKQMSSLTFEPHDLATAISRETLMTSQRLKYDGPILPEVALRSLPPPTTSQAPPRGTNNRRGNRCGPGNCPRRNDVIAAGLRQYRRLPELMDDELYYSANSATSGDLEGGVSASEDTDHSEDQINYVILRKQRICPSNTPYPDFVPDSVPDNDVPDNDDYDDYTDDDNDDYNDDDNHDGNGDYIYNDDNNDIVGRPVTNRTRKLKIKPIAKQQVPRHLSKNNCPEYTPRTNKCKQNKPCFNYCTAGGKCGSGGGIRSHLGRKFGNNVFSPGRKDGIINSSSPGRNDGNNLSISGRKFGINLSVTGRKYGNNRSLPFKL